MPKFIAGLLAGALVLCAGYALASRNSSGTMSAANGPYIAGTTISSSSINSRYADIESEITDSLSRSGKGGMTAALKGIDGTVAAPAFSWTSEPGTGLYRIGAGDLGVSVLGSKKLELTSSLFTVTPATSLTSTLLVDTGHTQWLLNGITIGSFAGMWAGANASAPTSSNYSVAASATTTSINATTNVQFTNNDTIKASVTSAGLIIGSSGTAISARYRATVTGGTMSGLGPLGAVSSASTTVTVTGATTAGDCTLHFLAAPNAFLTAYCYVSSANTVTILVGNPTAGAQGIAASGVSVVVEQP